MELKKQIEEKAAAITTKKKYFNQEVKDMRNFQKELIDGNHKIQHTLNNVLIFVRKNRNPKMSIEKQFSEELYKNEAIQNFVKRDPKLKSVLYECQKVAPLNESDKWSNLKNSRRMNRAFTYIWWHNYWPTFKTLLDASINKKQHLTSELNQGIVELWKRDANLCTDVVYELLQDSAGEYTNLQTTYVGDFRGAGDQKQKNRRKAQSVMDSYESLKYYNEWQKKEKDKSKTTISPQKETIKPESTQSPTDKIQGKGAVPKTRTAVTNQPAAFETPKEKVVKETPGTSGLNLKKEKEVPDKLQALKEKNKSTATIPLQKETTKPESTQLLAGKIQGTGAVPKTNTAVTNQPAAFETSKEQVVKEIPGTSGLNLKKEKEVPAKFQEPKDWNEAAIETNRQKQENGRTEMNNGAYKRPKEKVLEVMDSVPDKNNNYYKQVMETLKKREEFEQLDNKVAEMARRNKLSDEETLVIRAKQKMLTMEEVVDACHSFQHITDNAESGKALFAYLYDPIVWKKVCLEEIKQNKNGKHREDIIEWTKGEQEKLTIAVQSGCLDLQDKLTSMETKNYIFTKTAELFHSKTYSPFKYRELTNGEAAEKGYREIAIDSFLGTKEEERGIFNLFYDYLKHNERLQEVLKRKNLSHLEKKAYTHIAVTRSDLGISADAIPYIHGKFERKSSVINQQIADKNIAALIDKEVSIHTVAMCDNLLGKTKVATVNLMPRLYEEARSTEVKKYIREKVDAALTRKEQLHFYKETILHKLTKENQQELVQTFNHLLNQTSDSSDLTSKKLHQFEKVYEVVHSEESKARYDYLESKELLNGLGKITFGQEAWEKFDKSVLLKQEVSDKKVKETIQLPEMMKKSVEEIRKQRIENALRTIEADKREYKRPDEIADTMLKLKTHFADWDDTFKERVQTYLTAHLSKETQEQVGQIFKDKEVLQEVLSILPKWEGEWQKILDSLARTPAVNKIEEVKEVLDEKNIDYVFPVAAELIRVELNNKNIPHSTHSERKKVLDLLKNTEKGKELIGSITEKLQSNEFQPSEDKVNRWINDYLKMDEEDIEAEKKEIVSAIEELISKNTKKKDTALTDFRKDLVRAEEKIEGIMRTAFLEGKNHNFYGTDKEEKFADGIYQRGEIRHWVKQNPALKEVFYECQKRVPFNELSLWNHSEENERVKPNIKNWWSERWNHFNEILEVYADKKQFLTSTLNQKIEVLKEVEDSNQSAEVVWSLVVDKAGVPIDLHSRYRQFFDPSETDNKKDIRKAKALVDSYICLKEHNQEQKEARIQTTATIPPQKETTKRESTQSLADKIKVTGTVPKTNPAVMSQPAAFATIKRQVTKEIPGTSGANMRKEKQGLVKVEALKDLKKEALEINQQKKEKESTVQKLKKVFGR